MATMPAKDEQMQLAETCALEHLILSHFLFRSWQCRASLAKMILMTRVMQGLVTLPAMNR